MLQLIGWMGCLYLFVKGFEFIGNSAYQNEGGRLKNSAVLAVAISWLGAFVFFFAFTVQGFSSAVGSGLLDTTNIQSEYPKRSAAWHECITAAKDAVEAAACKGL